MNEPNEESPLFQAHYQVVERVLELGKNQKSLLRVIEEALFLEQLLELAQFGFRSDALRCGCFNGFSLVCQLLEQGDFLMHLLRVLRQSHGFQHFLQALALVVFHFFQLFRGREVRRRQTR